MLVSILNVFIPTKSLSHTLLIIQHNTKADIGETMLKLHIALNWLRTESIVGLL
jgi:hypothetical protein